MSNAELESLQEFVHSIRKGAGSMLSLLFEVAVRTTLIALAIALVLLAMRVRQTTLRHAVWTVFVHNANVELED